MSLFEYSAEFRGRIVHLHRGKEHWPHYAHYINAHLGGTDSRLFEHTTSLVREIEHHCGPLAGQRVLDFGCGTGASTAALASAAGEVVGFDVDAESADIARQRLAEHRFARPVPVFSAESFDEVAPKLGLFDLVLLNGVLEHIPLSIPGLRERVFRSAWGAVRPGGCLYINDTPNRAVPYDAHSTQLWWIPWTRPGSQWAYRRAVEAGRHTDSPTSAKGPLGLEQVGAWGATWWELQGYLKGERFECINLQEGHADRLSFAQEGSPKRRLFEKALHATAVRLLKVPLTALAPSLNHLALRKKA